MLCFQAIKLFLSQNLSDVCVLPNTPYLTLLWSTNKQWLVHVSDLLVINLSIVLHKALFTPISSLKLAPRVHLPIDVINTISFVVVSKHKVQG